MKSRDFLKELQVLVLVGLAVTAIATGVGIVQLLTGAPIQAEVFIDRPVHPADRGCVMRDELAMVI